MYDESFFLILLSKLSLWPWLLTIRLYCVSVQSSLCFSSLESFESSSFLSQDLGSLHSFSSPQRSLHASVVVVRATGTLSKLDSQLSPSGARCVQGDPSWHKAGPSWADASKMLPPLSCVPILGVCVPEFLHFLTELRSSPSLLHWWVVVKLLSLKDLLVTTLLWLLSG